MEGCSTGDQLSDRAAIGGSIKADAVEMEISQENLRIDCVIERRQAAVVKTRKRRSLQPSSNSNGRGGDKTPNLRDRWRAQRQRLMKWLDN